MENTCIVVVCQILPSVILLCLQVLEGCWKIDRNGDGLRELGVDDEMTRGQAQESCRRSLKIVRV